MLSTAGRRSISFASVWTRNHHGIMTSRRVLKAASAIREVVSTAILLHLRDPRIENVTVTYVEVSGDMRQAKVHVSIMGDQRQQDLCMHGLRSATGFLQQKVSERIDARYTPRLKFVLDQGVKKSAEVSRILGELLPETEETVQSEPDGVDERFGERDFTD